MYNSILNNNSTLVILYFAKNKENNFIWKKKHYVCKLEAISEHKRNKKYKIIPNQNIRD